MSVKGNLPCPPRCGCKEPKLWYSPVMRTPFGTCEVLIECDRCHEWWQYRYDPACVERKLLLNCGTGPKGKPKRYVRVID